MSDAASLRKCAANEELGGTRLIAITIAFMLSILMIALDQDIISTAIPTMTTRFGTTNDIGLWGSAYLLAQMALQPPFGRVYMYFNNKRTFQVSLALFSIGSILCASAVSSSMFTTGRAIAGSGAAGIASGAFAIGSRIIPLQRRPLYLSIVGSMDGVSSIAGPLLGGVFTGSDILTWRFSFWINLPISAFAMASVIFSLPNMPCKCQESITFLEKLARLDLQGAAALSGASVCVILALQWASVVYPWSDSRVWGCLLGAGLLLVVFIIWEVHRERESIFPRRLILQRSMGLSSIFLTLLYMVVFVHTYYLPLYFQVVQRRDAEQSGIRLLPYLTPAVLATIVSGVFITKTGLFVPLMWLGSTTIAVGCWLLRTLEPDSSALKWVGYQVLTSMGFGLAVQVPYTVVQVVLKEEDVPMGNALLMFCTSLGGSVSLTISQNVFSTTLVHQLSQKPDLANLTSTILTIGATDLDSVVSSTQMEQLIGIYSSAITQTFFLPAVSGGLAFVISLGMEWRRLQRG
ncbi:hypothetical protein V6Z77_003331 [Aspergillus fumigatus]